MLVYFLPNYQRAAHYSETRPFAPAKLLMLKDFNPEVFLFSILLQKLYISVVNKPIRLRLPEN